MLRLISIPCCFYLSIQVTTFKFNVVLLLLWSLSWHVHYHFVIIYRMKINENEIKWIIIINIISTVHPFCFPPWTYHSTHDLAFSLWYAVANTFNENYSTVEFLGVICIFVPKNTWKTNNFLPSFKVPCLDLQITLPQIFFYSKSSIWTSQIYNSKWTCVWAKFLMAIRCNMQSTWDKITIWNTKRSHFFLHSVGTSFISSLQQTTAVVVSIYW